jgi:poly-gamma-glutamate capsule biosynthesis protein CapA/YwtB (metallophosphatase superfamily)
MTVDSSVARAADVVALRSLIATLVLLAVVDCARAAEDGNEIAKLWIGGDVHLGRSNRAPLARIQHTVGADRIGLVNLEGPVSDGEAPKGRLFNGTNAIAPLFGAGVRVAGIANNHAEDAGPQGELRTIQALERAGLRPAGRSANAAIIERAHLKIAITAHDLTHGVPETLAAELSVAKGSADLLISTFHVTGPPLYFPRPELERAAAIALASGASVVAAHGTHAIGPIERRDRRVVAWGLGNLAFECDCTDEQEAIILLVDLDRTGVVKARAMPIDAGLRGEASRLAADAGGILDLLEAIGSSPLDRDERTAAF